MLKQDKQQQWVQIGWKHGEFFPLYQLILQGAEFVSRKIFPPHLQNFKIGNPVSRRLDYLFHIFTLITQSFSDTTHLLKASCPHAQGTLCRCWLCPFPLASWEFWISVPRPKSGDLAFCEFQQGKKWPDTLFYVIPFLLSAFLIPSAPFTLLGHIGLETAILQALLQLETYLRQGYQSSTGWRECWAQ